MDLVTLKKTHSIIIVASLLALVFAASIMISTEIYKQKHSQLLLDLEGTTQEYNDLASDYDELNKKIAEAEEENKGLLASQEDLNEELNKFRNETFRPAEDNCTAVTIVYYTNFSSNQQILTLSVPHQTYESYQKKFHPEWDERNLESANEYITPNETTIKQIVETVKNHTESQEELANALLDFVQEKNFALSLRYYPTSQLKYPIETLVEMGGDCDTHAFLYASLMRAAGFKVILLLSTETVVDNQLHVAVGINLQNPPENSLPQVDDAYFTYQTEKYYFAETTTWNYRVGDLPENVGNINFYIIPV